MAAEKHIVRDGAIREKGQVEIVTLLRGFAATSVFLFHLVCLSSGYISGAFLNSFFFYGKYGVQFFFVISGFVIPYSMLKAGYEPRDFFTFFKKRIIRIEPPYLCMVALNAVFLYMRARSGMANGATELPTWQQILFHVGYLIPFSNYSWLSIVFWTLAIEFQFYLFFSLAYLLFVKEPWKRWLVSAVLVAVSFISRDESHFFYWGPVFLMGIYLALLRMGRCHRREYMIVTAVLTGLIVYKMGWVIAAFALAATLAIYSDPPVRSRALHFLGQISYSLYLSHTLVAFAIINLGIRLTRAPYQKALFVSAAVAATLFFSYLLYYFVERPAKKWAAAIRYRHV